ncbi:MAG: nucleotidyltransferase family protein [Nitrospira sp.]|nr:nucleotidyltransferase family protein [Nitrospira sp.]
MKLTSFEAIVRALNNADVRYLIAGGLAVNAHGYLRFTNDADVVIRLIPDNVRRAFAALEALGYTPVAPVTAEQFADSATREGWIRDKHMQVLQLWSDRHRETPIDIFVYEPFPFEDEYAKALIKPLYGTIEVRFVSIPTLIAMKEAAGREQDRIDIEHLRMRLEDDAGR